MCRFVSYYCLDISIFLGPRSNTNSFCKNGTLAENANNTNCTFNVPSCQQISLPLTYDDGINLLPKRCDRDKAYFACDVPRKLGW